MDLLAAARPWPREPFLQHLSLLFPRIRRPRRLAALDTQLRRDLFGKHWNRHRKCYQREAAR